MVGAVGRQGFELGIQLLKSWIPVFAGMTSWLDRYLVTPLPRLDRGGGPWGPKTSKNPDCNAPFYGIATIYKTLDLYIVTIYKVALCATAMKISVSINPKPLSTKKILLLMVLLLTILLFFTQTSSANDSEHLLLNNNRQVQPENKSSNKFYQAISNYDYLFTPLSGAIAGKIICGYWCSAIGAAAGIIDEVVVCFGFTDKRYLT